MYCGKCGAKLPDDARFCYVCGEKTIVAINGSEEEIAPEEKESAPDKSEDNVIEDIESIPKEHNPVHDDQKTEQKRQMIFSQMRNKTTVNAACSLLLFLTFSLICYITANGGIQKDSVWEVVGPAFLITCEVIFIPFTHFIFPPQIFKRYCLIKHKHGGVTPNEKMIKNIAIASAILAWSIWIVLAVFVTSSNTSKSNYVTNEKVAVEKNEEKNDSSIEKDTSETASDGKDTSESDEATDEEEPDEPIADEEPEETPVPDTWEISPILDEYGDDTGSNYMTASFLFEKDERLIWADVAIGAYGDQGYLEDAYGDFVFALEFKDDKTGVRPFYFTSESGKIRFTIDEESYEYMAEVNNVKTLVIESYNFANDLDLGVNLSADDLIKKIYRSKDNQIKVDVPVSSDCYTFYMTKDNFKRIFKKIGFKEKMQSK